MKWILRLAAFCMAIVAVLVIRTFDVHARIKGEPLYSTESYATGVYIGTVQAHIEGASREPDMLFVKTGSFFGFGGRCVEIPANYHRGRTETVNMPIAEVRQLPSSSRCP